MQRLNKTDTEDKDIGKEQTCWSIRYRILPVYQGGTPFFPLFDKIYYFKIKKFKNFK